MRYRPTQEKAVTHIIPTYLQSTFYQHLTRRIEHLNISFKHMTRHSKHGDASQFFVCNVRTSSIARWKARGPLPIAIIEHFSLELTVEMI